MPLITKISIAEVDFGNRDFKISRNSMPEILGRSVKDFGIKNPPYLVNGENGLLVLFGLNRIECAKAYGISDFSAFYDEEPSLEFYIDQSIIKSYNNEIGPIGRLNLIRILKRTFRIESSRIENLARKSYQVPGDFLNDDRLGSVLSLPEALKDYMDARDVQFKFIDRVIKLNSFNLNLLSLWSFETSMRVNIFRSAVDILYDLQRSGDDLSSLSSKHPGEFSDRKSAEEFFLDELYKKRYPQYSSMAVAAEECVKSLRASGVEAEVPKYFDGDRITLKIDVRKNERLGDIRKKIDSINEKDIETLQALL